MSLISRLFRREGSSKIEFSSTTNKNAPPTFVPELIRSKTWIVTDLDHLDKVSRLDPLAHFITYGMAERCFDDWFTLRDKEGKEVMQEAMRQLRLLNAKKILTQVYTMALVYGYGWLYTGKNRYIPESGEGGRIATLAAFAPTICSVYEYYSEETLPLAKEEGNPNASVGSPRTMKLELTVGKGGSMLAEVQYLPASDFILWCPRPIGRGYTGRSYLEPAWDMLTYLRYLFHSMTFYDIKIGHGLFTAWTKAGFSDDVISKWQNAFEDISIKRAMVIDSGQVERLEFIGPSGQATNFDQHIIAVVKMIAVAAEVPADLMMGAAAGAVTGSETNVKLGELVERRRQKYIDDMIRELLKRMGFNGTDYEVDWNVKYAQDEEEQAKIEQTHAQAMATKMAYMTVDEIREEDGLPPLPDGRGDKLTSEVSQFNMDVKGLQSPEEMDNTKNPEGDQI